MLTDQTTIEGLRIENLACIRGEARLFQSLSFAIAPGEGLFVRGANGSGKSSLLKLLVGLLTPEAGTIAFAGQKLTADLHAYRRHIAYLGHQDGLKPNETPRQALGFLARLHTSPSWERSADAVGRVRVWANTGAAAHPHPTLSHEGEGLRFLRMENFADTPIRYLSAGQRRRVALAWVLASRAKLWLLDEPTTALDDAATKIVYDALTTHLEAGGMFVVATHDDAPPIAGAKVLQL